LKRLTLQGIVFSLLIGLIVIGCDSNIPYPPAKEFVAQQEDLADYKSWRAIDYSVAFSPVLGPAHMGNDPNYARRVYINSAGMDGDEYTLGTILVKETFTWEDGIQKFAEMGGILAMAKRGGDFNPNGGGWEWLVLAPDLSVAARGGEEVMDGACNSCHELAKGEGGMDYVFPHPAEYAASEADFADYRTWPVTGEASEPHEVLGPAHKGEAGLRRVYKKPLLANPDTETQGYPTGTIIVKEVEQEGDITEITAMVKRGGDFNPEHGAWEWFMLDPSDLSIMGRGANLMDGMCNGCHASATEPKYGKDYVFKHPDDPFNN
jgi:mono/diheme cytochrome c family protein